MERKLAIRRRLSLGVVPIGESLSTYEIFKNNLYAGFIDNSTSRVDEFLTSGGWIPSFGMMERV